jgi:hypothetical protein
VAWLLAAALPLAATTARAQKLLPPPAEAPKVSAASGRESLEVLAVDPAQAAPGTTIRIDFHSAAAPEPGQAAVIFGTTAVRFENPQAGQQDGSWQAFARVPANLRPGTQVQVEIRLGPLYATAPGALTILEPLRILGVTPAVAEPGSAVTFRLSRQDPKDLKSLVVTFGGLTAAHLSEQPGTVSVKVPEQILDSDGRYRFPLYEVAEPAIVASLGEERSPTFRDLTVRRAMVSVSEALAVAVSVLILSLLPWILGRARRQPEAPAVPAAPDPSPREPQAAEEEPAEVHTVFVPTPPPEVPKDLVRDLAADECAVYVGAGLSASSGFPTWITFVSELLEWAIEERYVDRDLGDSLRSALHDGQADVVADSVVASFERAPEALLERLRGVFGQSEPALGRVHRRLLEAGFCAALTTNFDDLLERTFKVKEGALTPEDTDPLLEALSSRRFFLLKLYGSLDRPETLVISPAQYRESIAANRPFAQFLEGMFFSRTILFLGASLSGIEAYLRGIGFRGSVRRRHYALVEVDVSGAWRAKADLLDRRYGIQVIPYQPSTPSHPEVGEFLTELVERTEYARREQKERARSSPAVLTHGGSPLTRVRLENIGPFEELDLALDPGWTLLLGDNGVGKSTILEAIAVAICGKDAASFAGRLLRVSTKTARIALTVGPREYLTTLVARDGDEAEVTSAPSRPLEAEGWLAIGFPPLRTVSWGNVPGPGPEGKRRPTAEDLLPLVRGGVDPRLDELKQWLVNLDYWSRSEDGSGRGRRYAELRDELFHMASRLAEGLSLRFERVDPFTHQVTVRTDDGLVPIEAVSQGTSSLLGWTGFLLQRMYEVYGGQEGNPRQRYALVLIDEIDAHMHPGWQQILVSRLSELFPRAQFVASSHSPLIAGSLEAKSIVRFLRREGKVVLERPDGSFQGWRADQILTGPLFGLETSRDLRTQEQLRRYTELAAKEDLDEVEQEQLQELAAALKVRLPTPAERQEARQAYELVGDALDDRMRAMPAEERERLLAEARVQLQEAITGSRRPA